MRHKITLLLIIAGLLTMSACKTQKTGCPQPKKNWGAEKVLDELNKPKKRG